MNRCIFFNRNILCLHLGNVIQAEDYYRHGFLKWHVVKNKCVNKQFIKMNVIISGIQTCCSLYKVYEILNYWNTVFFWSHRHANQKSQSTLAWSAWLIQWSKVLIDTWSYSFKIMWSHDWLWIVWQRLSSCNLRDDSETMSVLCKMQYRTGLGLSFMSSTWGITSPVRCHSAFFESFAQF